MEFNYINIINGIKVSLSHVTFLWRFVFALSCHSSEMFFMKKNKDESGFLASNLEKMDETGAFTGNYKKWLNYL